MPLKVRYIEILPGSQKKDEQFVCFDLAMYVLWLYFAVDIILMYIFAKNNLLLYGYFRSQYYRLHSCIQLRNGSILFQHLQMSMFSSHLYIYTNISLYYNFCAWTLNAFYTLIVPCKKLKRLTTILSQISKSM